MKRSLFLASLLVPTTPIAVAAVGDIVTGNDTYIADGISIAWVSGNLQTYRATSPRLYDSAKGAEWAGYYEAPYSTTAKDHNMCWLHASSNAIQYWQSYYGVFAKPQTGTYYNHDTNRVVWNAIKPLPYGTIGTEDASYTDHTQIPDKRRLKVARDIYRNMSNDIGGSFSWATEWFFRGAVDWPDGNGTILLNENTGGYYANYFGTGEYFKQDLSYSTAHFTGVAEKNGTLSYYAATDTAALKNVLLTGFGIENSLQTESGKILTLNTKNSSSENGHTISCYGFTTNADGSIKSLLVADNNDNIESYNSALRELFIGVNNNRIELYEDSNCANKYAPSGNGVNYIQQLSYINTPDVLKKMLAEYSDTTGEAQVWNGENSTWGLQTADTNELPTESTGWDVNVNGADIAAEHQGYYHTYSTNGRAVLFDDHATNRTVTISGEVAASSITVAAADYIFQAAEGGGSIADGADLMLTNGATLDSSVELNVNNLTLEGGTKLTSNKAIVVTGDFLAALAPQATTFAARSTVTPQASVEATLDLRQADSVTLETSVNMNGNDLLLADDVKLILNMVQEDVIPCFTDIGELYIGDDKKDSFRTATQVYFGNEANNPVDYFLVYDSALSTLTLMLSIPEPGTATLSLLALAAIAARRRRS